MAMKKWVRVQSNRSLGAYEIYEAAAPWGDPEWPDLVPVFAGIAREIDWAAVDGALAGLSQTRLLRSPVGARNGPAGRVTAPGRYARVGALK